MNCLQFLDQIELIEEESLENLIAIDDSEGRKGIGFRFDPIRTVTGSSIYIL